jgi:hypothetical protein
MPGWLVLFTPRIEYLMKIEPLPLTPHRDEANYANKADYAFKYAGNKSTLS